MRVLQLTTEFPPHVWGGMGRSTPGLCEALAEVADVTVLVHDYLFGRTRLEIEQRDGYRIVWSPTRDYHELRSVIDFQQFDVVNAQIFFFDTLATQIDLPLVYTIRSVEEEDLKMRQVEITPDHLDNMRYQAHLVDTADRLIVCSRAERDIVLRYFPNAAGRIQVIPNGYRGSADEIVNGGGSHHNGTSGEQTILFVGRFSERKGVHVLIDAFELVHRHMPQARLVLVGGHSGYDDRAFLESFMVDLGDSVRQRIHYAGWIDQREDLRAYYHKADVLVVPSLYEPFGNVVLEGFAHALPVIASRVGGLAETVEHERSGLLVEPGNPSDLAEGLIRLLGDPARARGIGAYAHSVVRQRYTWDQVARTTIQVYNQAIEARQIALVKGDPLHFA